MLLTIIVVMILSALMFIYAKKESNCALRDLLCTANIITVLCSVIISMSCLVIYVITVALVISSIGYFSTIYPLSIHSL